MRRSTNGIGALDAHAVVERAVTGAIRINTRPETGSSLFLRTILEDALSAANDSDDPDAFPILQRFYDVLAKPDPWDKLLVQQRGTFQSGGTEAWIEGAPRVAPGGSKKFAVLLDTPGKIADGFDLAIDMLARQAERLDDPSVPRERRDPDTGALANALQATLDPVLTVGTRLARRIDTDLAPAGFGPAEATSGGPLRAAPTFSQPMIDTLREEMPGFVLDGIERVPPDSITLVQTHSAFVLAYLIGLNHAMAGELLWRGFPTERRGTHFRRFWNRSGLGARSSPSAKGATCSVRWPASAGARYRSSTSRSGSRSSSPIR